MRVTLAVILLFMLATAGAFAQDVRPPIGEAAALRPPARPSPAAVPTKPAAQLPPPGPAAATRDIMAIRLAGRPIAGIRRPATGAARLPVPQATGRTAAPAGSALTPPVARRPPKLAGQPD